jgi:hypothetical protein
MEPKDMCTRDQCIQVNKTINQSVKKSETDYIISCKDL